MLWPTALDAPQCDPSLFFNPSYAPERINEKRSESSRAQKHRTSPPVTKKCWEYPVM